MLRCCSAAVNTTNHVKNQTASKIWSPAANELGASEQKASQLTWKLLNHRCALSRLTLKSSPQLHECCYSTFGCWNKVETSQHGVQRILSSKRCHSGTELEKKKRSSKSELQIQSDTWKRQQGPLQHAPRETTARRTTNGTKQSDSYQDNRDAPQKKNCGQDLEAEASAPSGCPHP